VVTLERLGDGLHDSFAQYRRTYRVSDDNGRLMIQALGQGPERLLKQADGFAMRSEPASHIAFVVQGGHAATMKMEPSDRCVPLSGRRVGPGDPQSFHKELK
jgi:hypothetical protein